jgi:hypothetical protein
MFRVRPNDATNLRSGGGIDRPLRIAIVMSVGNCLLTSLPDGS